MKLSAIIFDLDDTLYAERDYVFSGFAAVAEAYRDRLGDPSKAQDQMKRLFDTDARLRVFNALLKERGIAEDAKFIANMIETYRTHAPQLSLYKDADEVLNRFKPLYKLGLITDGRSVTQWAKIDALQLRQRLDEIIVTSELGEGIKKPSPIPFEQMADRLGVSPEQCVYIADNAAKDFVAPNAGGWVSVQIFRDQGIYKDNKPASGGSPQHEIRSLDELDSIITC